MPSFLIHLASIHRLAEQPGKLPAAFAKALSEDVEYARFGALLADLPAFEGIRGAMSFAAPRRAPPIYARLYHEGQPVAFGLKMAELVSLGALVGKEAGLAFIAGYFLHVCLDRVFHSHVMGELWASRDLKQTSWEAQRRIERDIAQRLIGAERFTLRQFQLRKHGVVPLTGVSRGFYEIVRIASQQSFGHAPQKSEVDRWVQGFAVNAAVLSTSMMPRFAGRRDRDFSTHDDSKVRALLENAVSLHAEALQVLWPMIDRANFRPRIRAKFMERLPEKSVAPCAA